MLLLGLLRKYGAPARRPEESLRVLWILKTKALRKKTLCWVGPPLLPVLNAAIQAPR